MGNMPSTETTSPSTYAARLIAERYKLPVISVVDIAEIIEDTLQLYRTKANEHAPRSVYQMVLRRAIMDKIHELKRDGTLSISLKELMLRVPAPSTLLDGAPAIHIGPGYATIFKDICLQDEYIRQFIF